MSSFSRSFKADHLCCELKSHFSFSNISNSTQRRSNLERHISLIFKSSNCISKLPMSISKEENLFIVALRGFLTNAKVVALFKFLKPAEKCFPHISNYCFKIVFINKGIIFLAMLQARKVKQCFPFKILSKNG